MNQVVKYIALRWRLLPNGEPDESGMKMELDSKLDAWKNFFVPEIPAPPEPPLSLEEQRMSTLGEMLVPTKRRGRQPNPNSDRQKVFRTLRKILEANGRLPKGALITTIMKETGVSIANCNQYANSCPGIKRDNGVWSLA